MVYDFKKLVVWQEAAELVNVIYKVTAEFPRDELYNLTSQIRRSAISVAANIAEATGRYGHKDKINMLIIARGSLIETRSHLFIAKNLSYISDIKLAELEERYEILTKKLNSLIRTIRTNHLIN